MKQRFRPHEVQILTRVKIKNVKSGQVMTYLIVSESEANLKEGKLSVTTPIAKGLLGKKVGRKSLGECTFRCYGIWSNGNYIINFLETGNKIYQTETMTIFSRIIAGEIPCYKVAEDEKLFRFSGH